MIYLRLAVVLLIIFFSVFIFVLPESDAPKEQVLDQEVKVSPKPIKNENYQNPVPLSAKSAIVVDAKTGIVLFEKDANLRLLPASTTKLMTALVALENCSPQDKITISYVEKEPVSMGLEKGDTLTVESLLSGLLISSGNDAAYALATSCGDSIEQFVKSMNLRAKKLGMRDTRFANPAGFDDSSQYTTANDLAKLSKVAVTNPLIAKIVSTQSTVVADVTGVKTYYLKNINKLLGEVDGLSGVKTGQTEGSLEILTAKTTRGGNTVITVVLGSHDRFGESKELIEWTFTNYHWEAES